MGNEFDGDVPMDGDGGRLDDFLHPAVVCVGLYALCFWVAFGLKVAGILAVGWLVFFKWAILGGVIAAVISCICEKRT